MGVDKHWKQYYINYSDNEEIISYVKENYENALNTSEFKRIWEVIRKHRL